MKLQLDHVSYTYQGKHQKVTAVKDATGIFETGMLYAIVGASGSGKSTLLSLIAGLKLPSAGTVQVDGAATGDLDRSKLRREQVTVIYQNYNLFPMLTVLENVLYPLKLKGEAPTKALERAKRELAALGITPEMFHRLPDQLSGGEQQRVAIARSLAAGSDIILADEPTGNLDISNSQQIMEILLQLAHEEDRCVIMVTHDLELAEQADRVLMMRDGTLE